MDEDFDELCSQFERDWLAGRRRSIEEMLASCQPAKRHKLFGELIQIELELLRKSGETPNLRVYRDRFPDYAPIVDEMLAGTIDFQPSTTKAAWAGLHVRCPHCQVPLELLPDAQLETIRCSSCGSEFSLMSDDTAIRAATPVTEVAHFKLIERVGIGACGAVWMAHDSKLDRTVAVKLPRRGQFDEVHEKAFVREAQNAAQLSHPHIVPVYEVGRDGDVLYIVSEFVRGVTLAEWMTQQRLSAHEAVELTSKVADALHHAHERGVVHRDLKPGNIMLDGENEPHLMDFGLAKRDSGEMTMTVDGCVLGTPAYMSPEQARGDARAANRRSDVYSLVSCCSTC